MAYTIRDKKHLEILSKCSLMELMLIAHSRLMIYQEQKMKEGESVSLAATVELENYYNKYRTLLGQLGNEEIVDQVERYHFWVETYYTNTFSVIDADSEYDAEQKFIAMINTSEMPEKMRLSILRSIRNKDTYYKCIFISKIDVDPFQSRLSAHVVETFIK